MSTSRRPAEIRPLTIGRLTRVLFGIGSFVVIAVLGTSTLGFIGSLVVAVLGISFVVGGLTGNPGCEITAVPNLVLPRSKRIHCL